MQYLKQRTRCGAGVDGAVGAGWCLLRDVLPALTAAVGDGSLHPLLGLVQQIHQPRHLRPPTRMPFVPDCKLSYCGRD